MASLRVGNPDVSISWAWASLQTIRAVKKKGGIAILEECGSCNKHQEQLLCEEYQRLNLDYQSKTFDKIITRELQECQEADYILCPSKYVADSLNKCGVLNHKLIVIPYGVELNLFSPQPKKDDIFRILFVGSVGVRKGLIYLFKALQNLQLDNFECLIIGKLEPPFQDIFAEYQEYFTHIPRVEHSQIKEYYSNSSVFIFPSLDEGMAYVQLEAMACGLPVICTPNSGGDSVIREGEEGFIVPIRDSQAIQEKIEYLYQHPEELSRMSNNALKRSKDFTWDNYGTRLETSLKELLAKKHES
ncbi:glycosyltransferase family 4 protein [Nostoc sp.]|uniref:glycosyltransferase family 4 protein n=1 Tax=Nostoc sp. TaxID=1180 RepID=UPI002FF730F5